VKQADERVEAIIERANDHFRKGKLALEDNKRVQARDEFDKALDEILASGLDVRASKRLETFYRELVEKIYREEVPLIQPLTTAPVTTTPAIGFRLEGFEPAPLDPLSKLVLTQDETSASGNSVTTYRARKGDTIATIAAARKLSADELARLNGIAPDVELRAGQEIKLPIIKTQTGSEYKASLEKLLALYQESEKKAENRLAQAKKLYDEKLLFEPDLDQAQKAVDIEKAKVAEVRQEITAADEQIKQAETAARQQQIKEARDRERADELIGLKPAQSANGAIPAVIKWFQDHLHDPYSARYVHWSKVVKGLHQGEPFWIVAVRIRAKNAFNAYRLSDYIFYIRHNRVVYFDTD
jgi:LysM repeat protein